MSEFIMGLGISVRICSLYEELVCLTICNNEHTLEYKNNIELLKNLIDDETDTYDKLNDTDIVKYFNRIAEEDMSKFDSVKSRYYSKLKERKDLISDDNFSIYPFTLDTAISGKILLDALVKLEKQFLDKDGKLIQDDIIYELYSYHKAHRFTLISSNDFLERIAIDFDYNILDIPNISFDTIKKNFKCGKEFSKYLNRTLFLIGIEIINTLVNGNNNDVYDIYINMLYMCQLEVIIGYLDDIYIEKLNRYSEVINVNNYDNGKYIKKMIKKWLCR